MSNLKIGWAEENITPDKKIKLWGQFFERISEYVETPVTVTAMAVEACNEQMVICACDLVGVDVSLMSRVRELLAGKADGLNADKIIISATHTHTSHEYSGGDVDVLSSLAVLERCLPQGKEYAAKVSADADVMSPREAFEYIAERVAQAIKTAWESRSDAYYSNQFGRAAVGMNRRVCYDDGSAKMWGDTNSANFTELESGNDSGIELLYIFNEAKKLTGVMANIACPSQVVEHRSFVSSDYWGKVKILLREKFGSGLYVLGLCAPAGDQCPRDMIRWQNPETPIDDPNIKREHYIERNADPSMFDIAGSWKVGKRIAHEIIDVYDEIKIAELKNRSVFKHECLSVDLPVRRVTITEYEAAVKTLEDYVSQKSEFTFEDNARMHVCAGTIARYDLQQIKDIHTVELHIIHWDHIAVATSPFELFLDYGNQIRARSKSRQTFLIQLACGCDSYLPTRKAEKGGHYSAYVSSGIVGSLGGELLVRKTVEMLNRENDA